MSQPNYFRTSTILPENISFITCVKHPQYQPTGKFHSVPVFTTTSQNLPSDRVWKSFDLFNFFVENILLANVTKCIVIFSNHFWLRLGEIGHVFVIGIARSGRVHEHESQALGSLGSISAQPLLLWRKRLTRPQIC